jgi:hypothetical protein
LDAWVMATDVKDASVTRQKVKIRITKVRVVLFYAVKVFEKNSGGIAA